MMGYGLLLLVLLIAAGAYVLLRKSARGGASVGVTGDGAIRRLIRIADSDDRARANEAILVLGRVQSDEALEYLLGRAGGATYSADSRTGSVLQALGAMSHPRGVERLLQVVASGSVASEHALHGLDLVRAESVAVAVLLRNALESDDYHCVKAAVRTLERLRSPEAAAALDQFRREPARTVIRRELESGRIPESTSVFGQRS